MGDIYPEGIKALLERGDDFSEEQFDLFNLSLQSYLDFFIEQACDHDTVGALEALSQVFDGQSEFYLCSERMDLSEEGMEGEFCDRDSAPQDVSLYLINLNYFGDKGGFAVLFEKLEETGASRPGLEIVHWIVHVLQKVLGCLKEDVKSQFGERLRDAVFHLLDSCDADILQGEQNASIVGILTQLEHGLKQALPGSYRESYDKFKVTFGHRLLRLGLLDKRMLGLKLIGEVADGARNAMQRRQRQLPDKPQEQWMSIHDLSEWMVSSGMLEYLYGEGTHAELLSRCANICPGLLAENNMLSEAHINVIWNAAVGQHESILTEIYKALPAIALQVNRADLLLYMYAKMEAVPFAAYDAHFLSLLQSFSHAAAKRMEYLADPNVERSWFGLELLWRFTQDDGSANPELVNVAQGMLGDFFQHPVFQAQRPVFMERCAKSIEAGLSVPQAQSLLIRIISTYPSGKEENQVSFVIMWLHKRYSLLDLIVQDAARYQTLAQSLMQEWEEAGTMPDDVNRGVFRGERPHHVNVVNRKTLLSYVLARAPIKLSKEQLDMCWSALIANAVSEWERSETFEWWRASLRPTTAASAEEGANHPLFDDESALFVFEKFHTLSADLIGSSTFACFRSFFNRCNSNAGLMAIQGEGRYLIRSPDLLGMETLWRLAITTADEGVAVDAATLLVLLQKRVDGSMRAQLKQYRNSFVEQCLGRFQVSLDEANFGRVERCAKVLQTFLFELKGRTVDPNAEPFKLKVSFVSQQRSLEVAVFPHTTIGELFVRLAKEIDNMDHRLLRLIFGGTELKFDSDTLMECKIAAGSTVHCVIRPEVPVHKRNQVNYVPPSLTMTDPELAPSALLSSGSNFERLYGWLDHAEPVGRLVWEVIVKLPINETISNRMRNLAEPVQWDELLPMGQGDDYKLFYAMRVVDSLVAAGPAASQKWLQDFASRGGLKHLGAIFLHRNFMFNKESSVSLPCLGLLLQVVVSHCVDPQNNLLPSASAFLPPKQLLERVMVTLALLAKVDVSGAMKIQDVSIVAQLTTELLVPLVSSSAEAVEFVFVQPRFSGWLEEVLLGSSLLSVRSHVGESLHAIAIRNPSTASAPLLQTLLQLFESCDGYMESCSQFFTLLEKMISKALEATGSDNGGPFEQLARGIAGRILSRGTFETRFGTIPRVEDFVMQGYIQILSTILAKNAVLASSFEQLLQFLFGECLFNPPTLDDHGPLAAPVCKRKSTRQAALTLLQVLCRSSESLYKDLTTRLMDHHSYGERRSTWSYLPASQQRDVCGYVGLKNLGATCYMNSFMQNLYMHPEFRKGILEADPLANDGAIGMEKNVLYQLQNFFGHLQESELKAFDTRRFVESYPLSPVTQQDVDEFMNLAFDKFEALFKGTKQDGLPGRFFGGSVMNQIISKECEHLSEREEAFMALSLEVKGKRNLAESLQAYIQGDLLSGDNKYECAQCNKKVDAVKRVCVNRLPDTILLSLKRFAFNYETFVREKVNSHFDFPLEMDLYEYSRSGLAEQEGTEIPEEAGKFKAPDDRDYYKYRLVGIVVHTGTTETGHYYAFARERVPLSGEGAPTGRWISFNDSSVEEYDPAQIPADAFGGLSDTQRFDPKTNAQLPPEEKMYSAYMLFYERVGVEHDPSYSKTAQGNVPDSVLETVWGGNADFAMDKAVFSEDYFSFLWALVRQRENAAPVGDVALDRYDPTFQAIRLGTKFLFETLCHAKQKNHLQQWSLELTELYRQHIPACRWLLDRLTRKPVWIVQTFFKCPVKSVRDLMAELIISVMQIVSAVPSEPEHYIQAGGDAALLERAAELAPVDVKDMTVAFGKLPSLGIVARFVDSLMILFNDARVYWKNFGEFWKLIESFVQIGDREREYFAARRGPLFVCDCYLGDASFVKTMWGEKPPRKRMEAKSARPDLSHMMGIVATMVTNSRTLHPASENVSLDLEEYTAKFLADETMWKWALTDGTCSEAMGKIAVWICWDDWDQSQLLLDRTVNLTNELNANEMDPCFSVIQDVLAIEDKHQEDRAARFVPIFLRMMDGNTKYKACTAKCIQFLASASSAIPAVCEAVFQTRARWMKKYMCCYESRTCRLAAEKLFKTLTGEADGPTMEEWTMVATNAVDQFVSTRVSDLFASLYELMPSLHELLKVDKKMINQNDTKAYQELWMLDGYFRSLLWCVRSMAQVESFIHHFATFKAIYLALEATRNEADLNRKELIRFWHKCFGKRAADGKFMAYPFLVKDEMLKDEGLCLRFIDFFVSLRSTTRYIEYNNTSLVPFYEMLLSLLDQSSFVTIMAGHRNYDWSVQFLWLETTAYPNIAPLIKEVCRRLCSSGSTYRQRHLQWVVTLPLMEHHWSRVLFYLEWLVADQADAVVFCRTGGLQYLSQFFHALPTLNNSSASNSLAQAKPVLTGAKVEPFVARALRIFQCSIKWMDGVLDGPAKDMKTAALEQWEKKDETVKKLLLVCVMFQLPNITSNCYCCLQVMASVDSTSRVALLQCLSDFHAMFAKQGVARLPHHLAMANPHQAEHTQNLHKLHEYYSFVKEVVKGLLAAVSETWDDSFTHACNVALMVAMECPLTLGHLCDSFLELVSFLWELNPEQVYNNDLFVPLIRHLLTEGSAPKLTSPNTMRFVRNSIVAFRLRLDAEELQSLTQWCVKMASQWLLSSESGAVSVALSLVSVCLQDEAFRVPLMQDSVVSAAMEADVSTKLPENRAMFAVVAKEWADFK